jgi:hypothetical protein
LLKNTAICAKTLSGAEDDPQQNATGTSHSRERSRRSTATRRQIGLRVRGRALPEQRLSASASLTATAAMAAGLWNAVRPSFVAAEKPIRPAAMTIRGNGTP